MTANVFNYPQIAAAVYQSCTTYDQYLPQLAPDVAKSWAKVFRHSGLSVEDLLAGVDKVYLENGAGYRPLPADIARAGRAIREDRAQREGWAELEARQAANEAKVAEETRAIAAAFKSGPVHPTKRLQAARDALDSCQGKREAQAAIHEFFAAKAEARPKTRNAPASANAGEKIAAARASLDGEGRKR
jgi:hypothetical protein